MGGYCNYSPRAPKKASYATGEKPFKKIGRYGRILLKYSNKLIVKVYLKCHRLTSVKGQEPCDHLIN